MSKTSSRVKGMSISTTFVLDLSASTVASSSARTAPSSGDRESSNQYATRRSLRSRPRGGGNPRPQPLE